MRQPNRHPYRGQASRRRASRGISVACVLANIVAGLGSGCLQSPEDERTSRPSPRSVEKLRTKFKNEALPTTPPGLRLSRAERKREEAKDKPRAPIADDGEGKQNTPLRSQDEERVRRFSAAGTLRGEVRKVSEGAISLGNGKGKAQTLRGTPFTLGKINRGDDVEIPFVWVGNRRWLTSPTDERPPLEAFAVRGQVQGPVTRLNRKRGVLGIGKLRFKAHPNDLKSIAIGQNLRVDFVEVDHRLWIHAAEPAWKRE